MLTRVIALSALSVFMAFAAPASGVNNNSDQTNQTSVKNADDRMNRGDYQRIKALRERSLTEQPSNNALRWEIVQEELMMGNIDDAENYLKPLLKENNYRSDACGTQGLIHYLRGEYRQAEQLLLKSSRDLRNQIRLLYVYYQTGQYSKVNELFDNTQLKSLNEGDTALLSLMKSFGNEQPYRPEWRSDRAVLPFISMNNLPIVKVKVNGQPINVFIDTGADRFVLKSSMAKKLELKPVASFAGIYAGGKTAETGYSRLNTLDMGDVTLHSVPVDIAAFPDSWIFTDETTGKHIEVDGILSTGVFHQFLTTLDYPARQLVLSPRLNDRTGPEPRKGVHIPFILEGTHFMIVKGAINGKDGMTFFLDSGLDDPDVSILLQKESLNYAGITLQTRDQYTPDGDKSGLGGGGFEITPFAIDSASVGTLKQTGLTGLYGVLPEGLYHTESGMILDGFVSHQFLKKYKWTMDFDSMVMTFE